MLGGSIMLWLRQAASGDCSPAAIGVREGEILETALILVFVVHGLAMMSMAAVLARFLPGGGGAGDAARIARIATHPLLFRLAWIPWQLCAVLNVVLAIALVRTAWIRRLPAIATLTLTVAAVVPDQYAQILWVSRGVTLAGEAVQSGASASYLAFEGANFKLGSGWAGVLYTLAAIGWTWCFVRTPIWSRSLGWLSAITWTAFALVSPLPLLPEAIQPRASLIATGNAVSFVLLEVWLAAVAERVLRRARPATRTGVHMPWRHPWPGLAGRACDVLANSRLARALCSPLPMLELASDISDVIYVSYLVPADRLAVFVPEGLELQRLGPENAHALFTFLSYRHGHFGPRGFGRLRRLFPSPIQTNWRVYVRDPESGRQGIHFVTNAIGSTLLALGARLLSEGMPMHVLARRSDIERAPDGSLRVTLDPGGGSAPDARLALRARAGLPELTAPWSTCFADWRGFLAYTVPQDRAMASQPWQRTISRQEIDLGIPLDSCEPLEGEVRSAAAQAFVDEATPLCFRVPRVSFLFTGEMLDPCEPAV
jgi:hypothetical protein